MTMIKILVNLLLYFFLIVIRLLLLLLLLILNPVFINMKFFDDWHEKKKQQEHLNQNLISHTKQKTHAEKKTVRSISMISSIIMPKIILIISEIDHFSICR